MVYHINPHRDLCENAIKITLMVLFTYFFILAENFLHHLSLKHDKECFLKAL